MNWDTLVSTRNLKLAWRRINTARNLQYKRFFREAYLVYECAVDEHLRELHKRLAAKVWQPSHATRLYLPKPSGLQRPLSLLNIEDQIVLQAIANVFASRLYKKRKKLELKTVFSNKLSAPKDSIFFIEHWQITYSAFQNKCIDSFNKGLRWSADFDLSAYYDTISHDLLLSIVFPPDNNDPDITENIKKWLQIWSADNSYAMTAHGIPQGPIASDFLAEAFFLPIDFRMKNGAFEYLRYVDDIRLFARCENDVRKAAIFLEQECRHRGLIPQSTKFAVRELTCVDEAIGALPSISPTDGKETAQISMTVDVARTLLQSSIDERPQRVKDKARFRYVMFRAPEDTKVLNTVLRLLPRHPEHIDAFMAYFSNFRKRKSIVKAALGYLMSGVPYSYVRGELWHVVARQGKVDDLRIGLEMARNDARERSQCVGLSWGVMHFLIRCETEGLVKNGRRISKELPISRSLLAAILPNREFTTGGQAINMLKGELFEQLAVARELQKRKLTISSLGLTQHNLSPFCNITLRSLGVINRQYRTKPQDWLRDTLASMYGCKHPSVWRELLGMEYEHAMQFLIEAKARFSGAYSEWLGLQDSLSDIVIRKLLEFIKIKRLQGYIKTIDRNDKLVKYGQLISTNTPFDKAFPSVAKDLRDIHNLINKLPGSHPYDEKGGIKNKWLTKKERDALIPKVKSSFDMIAKFVDQHI